MYVKMNILGRCWLCRSVELSFFNNIFCNKIGGGASIGHQMR